jgi:hypothetical protein
MSKVEQLRIKYPNINKTTFIRFVNGDTTPTKKYLDYMLRCWTKGIKPIDKIIENVKLFDELLPYIPLKDIYHFEYNDFEFLSAMLERAQEVKEDKIFKREDHCDVLDENDKYLMIRPRSFKGSLKYGQNTKWCTSSKNSESTFKRYISNGYLVYLIDKTKNTTDNFSKIAFYVDYSKSPLSGEFSIYNVLDKEVCEITMVKNGWDESDVFKIVTNFRYHFQRNKKFKNSFEYIFKFKESVEKLNFEELSNHIKVIDNNYETDYLDNISETINKFKNKIEEYGLR